MQRERTNIARRARPNSIAARTPPSLRAIRPQIVFEKDAMVEGLAAHEATARATVRERAASMRAAVVENGMARVEQMAVV